MAASLSVFFVGFFNFSVGILLPELPEVTRGIIFFLIQFFLFFLVLGAFTSGFTTRWIGRQKIR